jgi:hypothetical protein
VGNDNIVSIVLAANGKTGGRSDSNKGSICNWIIGESTVGTTSSDLDVGVSEIRDERLAAQTVHLVGGVTATNLGEDLVEDASWDRAIKVVLRWTVRRSGDCAFEEGRAGISPVGHNMVHDRPTSSRISKEGNLVLVSSELSDIGSHPLKSKLLIKKT